jgi:hypothetical protein
VAASLVVTACPCLEIAMRTSRVLLSLAAPALLAGCAATGGASQPLSKSGYDADVDWEKMSIITREAEMRGYKVLWVHPPQKRDRARSESATEG